MQNNSDNITILLIITLFLLMMMALLIISIVFFHRKKQLAYLKKIKEVELNFEKNLLNTQLEIQEQTFQHISREIHDNISLALTLAKLQLNTFNWNDRPAAEQKLKQSIELLGNSIAELSHLSKSMNTELINQQGLLTAVEQEVERIREAGLFTIQYQLTGETRYTSAREDLIIFRIIQEAFNNIIKHAGAKHTVLHIHYNDTKIIITISDDGCGFDAELSSTGNKAGLKNMESRIKMLGGQMNTDSHPGHGTTLTFTIPYEKQ